MEHLEELPVEELRDALDEAEGKKPTQRLIAAIAYKNGVTQTELAEWYGVQRRTIYNWLVRFDTDELLARAARNRQRSGRNRKLSGKQYDEFVTAVRGPPREAGLDAPAWTPALVRQYLRETYDIEYSTSSCRRLLKEAGLRYRKSGRTAAGSGGEREPDGSGSGGGQWTPR